jgi:prolipoprotein diacylglyceryl transferase
MIWDADPIMLDLGFVSIRWYGFLFSLGFLAGYAQMKRIYIREMKPLEDFDRLLVIMLVSTIVGARLGHCLFYEPAYYLSHPLEILRIWRGGLASHGGAIGILIGLYIFTRMRPSQPYPWLLDRIAIPTALAGCFIRVGNFFNSEILGEPTEVPWAVTFARIDLVPRHPAMPAGPLPFACLSCALPD